jgi:aldehyde dehydrogenase (NAD+)
LLDSHSPGSGARLAQVQQAGAEQYEAAVVAARAAFPVWSALPAPKRGEIVRQIGNALREKKEPLGDLVSLEMGKIRTEGHGEVQEMIDICDFAVGLSRQLYGLTMHSERPQHRMYEQWHPLGVVGVITAFNFPVAVWAWNAALAWVCGNVVLWKPSEKTPLCAVACQRIVHDVLARNGFPSGVSAVVIGEIDEVGERLTADRRIPLVSATGSVRMGKRVGEVVAARLGRTILELGGNNAVVVSDKADLDLALRAIAFGALGTAGQRCTSTRRVLAHGDIYDDLKARLIRVYETARVGDPLDPGTLVGPLIDEQAVAAVQQAIGKLKEQGGVLLCGGERLEGSYMRPTSSATRRWPTRSASTTMCRRASRPRSSPAICSRRRRSCPTPAATAASPMSTSGRAVRRSAGRSGARRRPAAAANRAATPGRGTCAGRPIPSTGLRTSRSPRGSSSTSRCA